MNTAGYWVLLITVIAVFIVIFFFFSRTLSKREKRKKEFYRRADRQRSLMLQYRDAGKQTLQAAPAADMIEGLASAVQAELADCAAPNDEFLKLPIWRQYAYAAYYLLSDSAVKLSAFFRNSGEPLVSTAVACVRNTGKTAFVRLIDLEYEMLDDNNENVSVDNAQLAQWDAAFAALDRDVLVDSIKQVVLASM